MKITNLNIIDKLYFHTARQHYLFTKLLPQSLRFQSIDYYLLFRIIDTIEDSDIPFDLKIDLFNLIKNNFINGIKESCKILSTNKNIENKYLNLLYNIDIILNFHFSFPFEVRKKIEETGIIMIKGMTEYLIKYNNSNDIYFIQNFTEFENYCYYAAGIVGKLNLDLFYLNKYISLNFYNNHLQNSVNLGIYLQIINIIRDFIIDKNQKKKIYLPKLLKNLNIKDQLLEVIRFAKDKEKSIIKFINSIENRRIKKYCATLFKVGKIHYDFYFKEFFDHEVIKKPNSLNLFLVLPFTLKINFLFYKLKKIFKIDSLILM